MEKLINIRRNSIKRKAREAAQYWGGVNLTGHFIGGKPVPRRAWLTLNSKAIESGLRIETVMAVLNLHEA